MSTRSNYDFLLGLARSWRVLKMLVKALSIEALAEIRLLKNFPHTAQITTIDVGRIQVELP